MPHEFLHQDKEFADLIRIVSEERPIDPILVEKDYWIMHCLYGLQHAKSTPMPMPGPKRCTMHPSRTSRLSWTRWQRQ